MNKKSALAVLAIFVTWTLIDFLIHGVILKNTYEMTAYLWRPMEEMKMGIIYAGTLIFSVIFVLIYTEFFSKKGIRIGLRYGLLTGMGVGFSMGYCTYACMPIPVIIAFVWFCGTVIETVIAGLILGALIKE